MKIIAKQDRRIILINARTTQNENDVETLEIQVPDRFEDYNKKIVFVTPDGIVWDLIENNEYKLQKAISKYNKIDFYIWLTKDDEDWRSETKQLIFYANQDASEEITPEEISGVNTVINMLEAEITKVENLNITANKVGTITTLTITDKEGNIATVEILDGQDGSDYVITEADYQAIANIVLEEINIPTKTSDLQNDSGFVTKNVNDLTNYYNKTEIDNKISSVYKYKGTVATYNDLPNTDLVVGDVYNVASDGSNYAWTGSNWDKLGGDIDLSGYQTKIDNSHKLASDLVDDTNQTNKFVSTSEKTTWNGKYDKPVGGIPKTDLASDVQTSLGKADTAMQSHQDISGKEDKTNKVTSISSQSTNEQYPSAKAVYDYIDTTITQAIGGEY